MTSAPPRPDDPAPAPRPDPAPPARPSGAQVLASVLTATTSTLALSYLGVAGTIIGAGLASTFTVLANYWYTRTILHTKRKVAQLAPRTMRIPQVARTEAINRAPTAADDAPTGVVNEAAGPTQDPATTVSLPAVQDTADAPTGVAEQTVLFDLPDGTDGEPDPSGEVAADATPKDSEAPMAPARSGLRRLILLIVVGFVLLLGLVTVVEFALGKPLSNALRGTEGSGTTLSNVRAPGLSVPDTPDGDQTEPPGSNETDAPSETPSEPGGTTPDTEPDAPAEPEAPAPAGDNAEGGDKPGGHSGDESDDEAETPVDPARTFFAVSGATSAE